jgi:uncharacterized membrane protein YeiH
VPLLIEYGDYFGTLVFAITGGLAAAEKKLDFGGFFLLAFLTGVGGGTVRDLVLDHGPVFWTERPVYVLLCLAGAVVVYVAGERVGQRRRVLVWCDAVGLAVFSVIGAGIALQLEFRPITAVLMGALTATGGGLIRDVVRNELPLMLYREVYMTAAAAGAAVMVGLDGIAAPTPVAMGAGASLAFALRAAGIGFDLHLPTYGQPMPPKA